MIQHFLQIYHHRYQPARLVYLTSYEESW